MWRTKWNRIGKGKKETLSDVCLFFRAQIATLDKNKIRSVWGFPIDVIIEEGLRRFRRVVKYFINTPIRAHTGQRWKKSGGVPSGSMYTNILDSIINCITTRYIIYDTTGKLPDAEMYLGDDGVLAIDAPVNMNDMAEVGQRKFGMEINVKKSSVTTSTKNIHFQGYFNLDGRPFKA